LREEFKETKEVTRIRKLKKDRQHNGTKRTKGQIKIYKTLQIYKTKDRASRTPLKTVDEVKRSGSLSSSCSTSGTRRVTLVANPIIRIEREVHTTSETYP
jgi:hypothetical protein